MSRRIEWVNEPERFAALAEDWEQLARQHTSPFGDHAWFQAWWKAFGTGSLNVCVLWEDGELAAALPLSRQRGVLKALANFHTPVFVAPARDGNALVTVVDEALDQPTSELMLHAVDVTDPLNGALVQCSPRHGRSVLIEQLYRSPRAEMTGDFEGYARAQGRRFKDLRRRWRKLNREHEARFRFEDAPRDLEADLEAGFRVEAAGWKGKQKTAILSSPQTRFFYTEIARAYLARGELRLTWLEIDGRPAAFGLCLERARRLYCLKAGMDDGLRPLSPGLLLDYYTIEHCFELGLERYELLGEDAAYKRYFATARSDVVRVHSYRRRLPGVARYLTRRLGRPVAVAVRQRLRR